MGARGRAPTPTKVLRMRGSWRAKLREDEPEPPSGEPVCPDWLDEEGRAAWDRTCNALRAMGLLSVADVDTLVGLCQNVSLFRHLSEQINAGKRNGESIGDFKKRVDAADKAYMSYSRACQQFGLTPASRARVTPNTKPSKVKHGKGRFFASS